MSARNLLDEQDITNAFVFIDREKTVGRVCRHDPEKRYALRYPVAGDVARCGGLVGLENKSGGKALIQGDKDARISKG